MTLQQLRALDEMLRPAWENSPSAEMVGRYRELLVRARNALTMSWPLDRNLVAGLRSAAKDLARAHRRVSGVARRPGSDSQYATTVPTLPVQRSAPRS